MNPQIRLVLNIGAAVGLAATALGFFVARANALRTTGEESARVWFYDQKSRRLYPTPRETVPPDGNGVRAIVVSFEGEEGEPGKYRIAYLEKYAPELKQLLERVRKAQASKRPGNEPIPSRNSPFTRDNTLVSQVGEAEWHPTSSSEGKQIMSQWRSWTGSRGQRPVVVLP
jgi:hypothetical protein